LFGSLVVSTQLMPHRTCDPVHPLLHENVAPIIWHTGMPVVHVAPHVPQCVGCDRSASHPSDGFVLQSAQPGAHVNPHVPPVHVAVACGGDAHGVQSEPQLEMAVLSTQTPPQL
jgi:hypothetical protein